MTGSVLAAALGFTVSCAEKKKSDIIITHKQEAPKKKATQRMEGYEQSNDVAWVGNTYKVSVKRFCDTSLPVLHVDETTSYYDNKITLRIQRQDGSEFMNRTFSKTDFLSYIDVKSMREEGALLGLVFLKAEGDNLFFNVSVGSPDITNDEYVSLRLRVGRMGGISISKDVEEEEEE